MKLEQVEQLIEIDKQKSISKAADALYMARSTLSGSLTGLENEIGVRLFERTANGVKPTAEGKEALQLAKVMVDAANQLLHLGDEERELRGTVTVYIGQMYGFLQKDLWLRFKQRYPKAELVVHTRPPVALIRDLTSGDARIALGLFVESNYAVIKEKGFQHEVYGRHQYMTYVSANSRFADLDAITLQALKDEQFLINSLGFWEKIRTIVEFNKEPFLIPERDVLRQAISAGDGITILPDLFAYADLYCTHGFIKALTIEEHEKFPQMDAVLVYPEKKALTTLEQNTVALMRELLQEWNV